MTQGIGTPLWMAPEILAHQKYGPSADVWSYAIVMWEIAAQARPWADVDAGLFTCSVLLKKIEAGERPAVAEGGAWAGAGDYVAVMRQCWARDPSARPAFGYILSALEL